MRFSANLGFLFREHPLPDAIRAAKAAGFDAVECHWPYETPPDEVVEALTETGFPMLGLNTLKGNVEAGDSGFSAIPERTDEARAAIEQAVAYAAAIGCRAVHVMAGRTQGSAARDCFQENLVYATQLAAPHGITILIEPLNSQDVEGYFLTSTADAAEILKDIAAPNLKIMYDLYHMEIMQGRHLETIRALLPQIGHIQFATVPGRRAPNLGAPDLQSLLPQIVALGYDGYFGAEFIPEPDETYDWLETIRDQRHHSS
jgi:2-dehydrotetronate isomerase